MKNPMSQWQSNIYQYLKRSEELNALGVGIFTYVPQNTKLPYIRLDKMMIQDHSTKTTKGISIIHEIHIYNEEKGNRYALIVANIIKELLESNDLQLEDYQIININLLSCHISQLKEGNISKAILKFKSIIEELPCQRKKDH